MTIFDVFNVAGGLALFLYGMSIMGSGLEMLAGGKLEAILQRLTNSVWKGVLGDGDHRVIQSNPVIVVGLVNSGILTLPQAIGIIMGANIGTTGQLLSLSDITGSGWIFTLSLKPSTFSPIVAFTAARCSSSFSKAPNCATSARFAWASAFCSLACSPLRRA